MLRIVFNGPRPLQPRTAGLRKSLRLVRLYVPLAVFFCCATFGANISRAQDNSNQSVADAARQERARKQELRKHAKHVYTEEDLKRQRILTPEDQAVVEARKNDCAQKNNCAAAPSQNDQNALDADTKSQQPSLGEVARQYRKQKELQALKPKQPAPFHLPLSAPAYASPVLPERPKSVRPGQPSAGIKTPSHVFRRDPFSAVPVRPRARLVAPAQPRVFSRSMAPPSLLQPAQPSLLANPAPTLGAAEKSRATQPGRSLGNGSSLQKTVNVQRGDSLWKLAHQWLGQGSRWKELLAANRWIADPEMIREGAQLNLPDASPAQTSIRSTRGRNILSIRVQRGDTLWNLAKTTLGNSSFWPCLASANPGILDPNRIYEDQILVVPVGCNP
ncbi:MAG TPA: LysM peptidoglycan-binding domain-containing protein [Candidatus Acidoferrum sp.]|nr:LysM peptidoglycan-binding domain-containing protein [Candidatus Acidoferrum sp.]